MSFEQIIESMRVTKSSKISEDGVLKDVHILGLKSKNGYTYAMEAITGVYKDYVGLDIYLNHKEPTTSAAADRDVTTKVGYILDTIVVESVGMKGDIQFNPEHPYFPAIKWWVEHQPKKLGFSHVAEARMDNATKTMIAIRKPKSVDLVSNPATTSGIFSESYAGVTEGVLDDKIAERRVQNYMEAFNSLYYDMLYNKGMVLTQDQLAVNLVPVVQDLLQELTSKDQLKKESVMDIKDLKLEDLKTARPDLVTIIVTEAVQAEKAIDAKVADLTKDLSDKAKSKVFVALVRESVVAGKDVTDIIEDRKGAFAAVVESVLPPRQTLPEPIKAQTKTMSDEDIIANFNK